MKPEDLDEMQLNKYDLIDDVVCTLFRESNGYRVGLAPQLFDVLEDCLTTEYKDDKTWDDFFASHEDSELYNEFGRGKEEYARYLDEYKKLLYTKIKERYNL